MSSVNYFANSVRSVAVYGKLDATGKLCISPSRRYARDHRRQRLPTEQLVGVHHALPRSPAGDSPRGHRSRVRHRSPVNHHRATVAAWRVPVSTGLPSSGGLRAPASTRVCARRRRPAGGGEPSADGIRSTSKLHLLDLFIVAHPQDSVVSVGTSTLSGTAGCYCRTRASLVLALWLSLPPSNSITRTGWTARRSHDRISRTRRRAGTRAGKISWNHCAAAFHWEPLQWDDDVTGWWFITVWPVERVPGAPCCHTPPPLTQRRHTAPGVTVLVALT